jgi:hypothetical protein
MVPSESDPQELSNEWSCLYVSTILNVLGNFCVPPLVTEVTISSSRVKGEIWILILCFFFLSFSHQSRNRLADLVAEHLDHLHYLNDILCLRIDCLNDVLTDHLLHRLLIPLYVYSLTKRRQYRSSAVSWKSTKHGKKVLVIKALLGEIFIFVHMSTRYVLWHFSLQCSLSLVINFVHIHAKHTLGLNLVPNYPYHHTFRLHTLLQIYSDAWFLHECIGETVHSFLIHVANQKVSHVILGSTPIAACDIGYLNFPCTWFVTYSQKPLGMSVQRITCSMHNAFYVIILTCGPLYYLWSISASTRPFGLPGEKFA